MLSVMTDNIQYLSQCHRAFEQSTPRDGLQRMCVFGKGILGTKEGRESVSDIFTKETGETFDVVRIKTWYRNNKSTLEPK